MSPKSIFISHRCIDHPIVYTIGDKLSRNGWKISIDPFDIGDQTCVKTQEIIKKSTHFILLNSINIFTSRWVKLEALFAKLCYNEDALCYFPIKVDNAKIIEEADGLIFIDLTSSKDIPNLVNVLAERIRKTDPSRQLPIDISLSEQLKEDGRVLERVHARINDIRFLHKAITTYEKAIYLNFCNHHAWANLAWCLWKHNETNRALKCIGVAENIEPNSNHVKDVRKRIEEGKRSII